MRAVGVITSHPVPCQSPRTALLFLAGSYGTPSATLTFSTLPSGEMQPAFQHLRIQGIADLDNNDGAVAVAVVCVTAVTGAAVSAPEGVARMTWVGSSAGMVVRNRWECVLAARVASLLCCLMLLSLNSWCVAASLLCCFVALRFVACCARLDGHGPRLASLVLVFSFTLFASLSLFLM